MSDKKYLDLDGLNYLAGKVATKDLSNVENATFFAKAKTAGAGGIPTVTTAGTGSTYTATVPGVTSLAVGTRVCIIPHTVSTSTTPTLNVNSLGAKQIRRNMSNSATSDQVGYTASWLAANKPFMVVYSGTYWIVEGMAKPAAADLYGSLAATKVSLSDATATALGLASGANAEDALTALDEAVASGNGMKLLRTSTISSVVQSITINTSDLDLSNVKQLRIVACGPFNTYDVYGYQWGLRLNGLTTGYRWNNMFNDPGDTKKTYGYMGWCHSRIEGDELWINIDLYLGERYIRYRATTYSVYTNSSGTLGDYYNNHYEGVIYGPGRGNLTSITLGAFEADEPLEIMSGFEVSLWAMY